MKMGVNADKETVLALAWDVAEQWLLDTGEGLDGEGNPDARELASRKAEVYERLGTAWDVAKDEYYDAAMDAFILEHRAELVAAIRRLSGACKGHPAGEFDQMGEAVYCDGSCSNPDDDEIEEWVNNDEGLYNWAKSEGAVE